jgi:xylose isomerase
VKDFARGCMRTYLILKEKAARWNADKDIQAIVKAAHQPGQPAPAIGKYSPANRDALLKAPLDRTVLASRGLSYEKLDQLTIEVLLGVR